MLRHGVYIVLSVALWSSLAKGRWNSLSVGKNVYASPYAKTPRHSERKNVSPHSKPLGNGPNHFVATEGIEKENTREPCHLYTTLSLWQSRLKCHVRWAAPSEVPGQVVVISFITLTIHKG